MEYANQFNSRTNSKARTMQGARKLVAFQSSCAHLCAVRENFTILRLRKDMSLSKSQLKISDKAFAYSYVKFSAMRAIGLSDILNCDLLMIISFLSLGIVKVRTTQGARKLVAYCLGAALARRTNMLCLLLKAPNKTVVTLQNRHEHRHDRSKSKGI